MLRPFKLLPKKFIYIILLTFIGIGFEVYCTILIPEQIGNLIKLFDTPTTLVLSDVRNRSIILAIYVGASIIIDIVVFFLVNYISSNCARYMRLAVFKKVNKLSIEKIYSITVPSLISRTIEDCKIAETGIQSVLGVGLIAPITMVGGIVFLFVKFSNHANFWWLFSLIGGALLLLTLGTIIMFKKNTPLFMKLRNLNDQVNDVSRENISGMRVIRAHNAQKFQMRKFDKISDDIKTHRSSAYTYISLTWPVTDFFVQIIPVCIYWLGGVFMKNQQDAIIGLTYADLLEISQLGVTILMGFTLMLISSVSIPQSIVSIKRVNEILDLKIDMKDPLKPVTSFNTTGKIEFKNVNFKYEGSEQNILTNISFTIKKGQTLGIVGPNGSGKSTLISLIPRFFDPKKGEILINDVNIKKINLKMLRSKIGYVGQKSFLFSGSIKENISYGLSTPPQDEHLNFISRNAEALEFIDTLPMKYNSVVSQNANNFSGGQKQRLSIARALAINPEILIFDDSFSALDLKTDKVLRGKLQNKFKHVTKIIVAQRVNTILDADKIIVLDDGKIIGMGTHQQLLKNCPLYCDITSSQLEQKEVATNEK